MSAELADEVLRWLAARPRLLADSPLLDLTACGGCGRGGHGVPLVILGAPMGAAYALCGACFPPERQRAIPGRRR